MYVAVREMRWGGTFPLLSFDLLSGGLFGAWYVWRQSRSLDAQLAARERVPALLVWGAILPGVALAPFLYLDLFLPVQLWPREPWFWFLMANAGAVAWLAKVPWAFAVRSRVHRLVGARKGELTWFNAFWTFYFVHYHLNYKLNSIDAHTRAGAVPEHAAR